MALKHIARLNVFFRGANGQLIEAYWNGSDWFWGAPHGLPPDGVEMASAPAAIGLESRRDNTWVLNVFFQSSNGQLVERDWDPIAGHWSWAAPHGLPPDGVEMASAPAAIGWQTPDRVLRNVYFKGANGQLYERWQEQGQPWQWFAHGLPPDGTQMASAPAAISWRTRDGTPQQDVFFQGDNGQLVEAHWDQFKGWEWVTDHGRPPGTQMASAPTAISASTQDGIPLLHVFLAGADGQLYEHWKEEGQEWQWFAHGLPPDGTQIVSMPAAVIWYLRGMLPRKNVFFQGNNGQLVGRYWDSARWQWGAPNAPHGLPPDGTQMASAPAAITYTVGDGLGWWQNVFFQGKNGSLIEAYWDATPGNWQWGRAHGAPPGTLMASMPAIVGWREIVEEPDPRPNP
jgi:hypothetical protein